MNKRILIIVLVFSLAASAAAYKLYISRQNASITATGTVEVTFADVVPKINGYMSESENRSR